MRIDANTVNAIVVEASKIFYDSSKVSNVSVKGFGNFVTEADKSVQDFIWGKLNDLYPEVQFFSEEKDNGGVDMTKSSWILDPIDGSLNVMHDFGLSAISVGYVEDGVLTYGVIYDPYRDELFTAEKGCGAFMTAGISKGEPDRQPIHVSGARNLSESLVMTGTSPYDRDILGKKYFEANYRVFSKSIDIRRYGAAVLDLAWAACGRVDVYFEHVYPWDRAAGMIIVAEAGGKVCSFDGSDVPLTSFHDICAGAPGAVEEVIETIRPIFYD